jgi:hypothetical protein
MIVDFIQIKRALDKAANKFIRAEIKKRTPFVSQIAVIHQHEGSDASYETVDRQVQETDYHLTLSKPITLSKDEMGRLSLAEIEKLLIDVAEDMAHKIERTALDKLGRILEDSGNTIVESGRLGPESFLRSLEVMQVDFDDVRERPHIPQIVLHPDTFARLKEQTDSAISPRTCSMSMFNLLFFHTFTPLCEKQSASWAIRFRKSARRQPWSESIFLFVSRQGCDCLQLLRSAFCFFTAVCFRLPRNSHSERSNSRHGDGPRPYFLVCR